MRKLIKPASLLAVVSLCLFESVLQSQSGVFREFATAFLSLEWMLLACTAVWCGSFLFLTFNMKDLSVIGLLLIAIVAYFIGYATSRSVMDALVLLAGVTLGRGTRVISECRVRSAENKSEFRIPSSELRIFLAGLVLLLAFSSWWHLEARGAYQGPRWMGLWDNPNIYGMLMGAGVVLAAGLFVGRKKEESRMKKQDEKRNPPSSDSGATRAENGKRKLLRFFAAVKSEIILFIAAGMMAVGLFFSYSRGAWVGTAVGVLYLARAHGRFEWRLVLPGICVVAAVVCFFWHGTADTDAWYLKRLDLSRPSAQHRVSAWRGALQMMRDHPFGVGWNKAAGVYEKDYSPPENGAAALTMNSYLMLGTELGLPGLVCFISYVALCLKSPKSQSAREGARSTNRQDACATLNIGHETVDATATACRAGAVTLLVAFWFDGGLFTLATASVFWILLELGTSDLAIKQASLT